MKKWAKRTINILTCALIIICAIIPCFAINTGTITILDVGQNVSSTDEVTISNNYNRLIARYDPEDSRIHIEIGIQDQLDEVYNVYLPSQYVCNVQIEVNGNMSFGEINPTLQNYVVEGGYSGTASQYAFDVNLELYAGSTLYTREQLEEYGKTQYQLGAQYALGNPNLYGYFTQEEYLEYGREKYAQGQLRGLELAEDSNYANGYTDGLTQGHKDAGTIKGIANIALTGIYNVFTYITGNTSIFGVALISVVVSALIILIVYFIFKLERS